MAEKYSKDEVEKIRAEVRIAENIESIKKEIVAINNKLDNNYVTLDELATFKAELNPYILAVKSFIGMAVMAIIVALFKLVIK